MHVIHTVPQDRTIADVPSHSPDTWTHRATVLVVEDHSALNLLLGIRLRNHGYEVRSAFDGIEAVNMAVRDSPDLVLLDMGLPRMSGTDVLRDLHSHPYTHDTPVIVMTGDCRVTARDLNGGINVYDVFYKPVPATRIVAAVDNALCDGSDP